MPTAAAAAAFPVDHALLDCQICVIYKFCSPPETRCRPIEFFFHVFFRGPYFLSEFQQYMPNMPTIYH